MYRAFIVDDDRWVTADIRQTLRLKQYGFEEIEEYNSAEEALAVLLSGDWPDLVVSDIRMGDMSGLDMIHLCHQKKVDTLFVLVSAYSDFDYVSAAFQYGVFDYLLKPISQEKADQLMRRVCAVLEERAHSFTEQERDGQQSTFERVLAYMRENYMRPMSLEEVASACYLTQNYLSSLLKKRAGMSFLQYRNYLRITEAKRKIRAKNSTITEIAYAVGFNDLNYFSRTFKKIVGVTPQEYQKTIDYRSK